MKTSDFYVAGFNAAKQAAAEECKRLSELAAQQDDSHGWAWASACQSEIQKLLPNRRDYFGTKGGINES